MTSGHRILRSLGPALARPAPVEILRSALGAGTGLLACGLLASVMLDHDGSAMSLLIAPLGASAFLAFCVPNSPLAQPWSAVVGNCVSALAAITVLHLVGEPMLAVPLAVASAVILMMLVRAMHPPGGAVALLIALNPALVAKTGFAFALVPVAFDTAVLVVLATLFNRATGRKYPFRQPPVESPHHTQDTAPDRRLGLSADDLGRILSDLRLAANIGPEDLARLIGAAEAEATARHVGGLTAADVMSHDVVTVLPDAYVDDLTRLFLSRGFKTLPVVGDDGQYLGLLSQADLLGQRDDRVEAQALMHPSRDFATPGTPLAPLLKLLADGGQQSVPVLDHGKLVGIVTRSDMIGALAYELSR